MVNNTFIEMPFIANDGTLWGEPPIRGHLGPSVVDGEQASTHC